MSESFKVGQRVLVVGNGEKPGQGPRHWLKVGAIGAVAHLPDDTYSYNVLGPDRETGVEIGQYVNPACLAPVDAEVSP